MELSKSPVSFNSIFHEYTYNGKQLPGVTSLMKKYGLSADYSGIPQDVLDKAAARGTEVHELLEAYDNGEMVVDTPDLKAYKKLKLNVFCSEYLVSDLETCASSIDKVIFVDEQTVDLADVKTTSKFNKDAVSVQLSIYKFLFELMNPTVKVRDLYGIHVRDGKAKLIKVDEWGKDNVERLFFSESAGLPFVERTDTHNALEVLDQNELDGLVTIETRIQEYEALAKALKEKAADYKQRIVDYMTANGIDTMDADGGRFTLKREYERTTFDNKAFAKDHPEVNMDEYRKTTTVAASVSFKAATN